MTVYRVKFVTLAVLFSFSVAYSASPIREICNDQKNTQIKVARSLEDLETNVCRLVSSSYTTDQGRALSKQVFDIIDRLKQDKETSKNWQKNEELDLALRVLSARVSEGTKATGVASSPLQASMLKLAQRYGTWEQRKADQKGYIDSLWEVLSQTSEGTRLKECFLGPNEDDIAPGVVVERPGSEGKPAIGYGGTALFAVGKDGARPGKRKRGMLFDYGMTPTVAVVAFAHELQHSCHSSEMIHCQGSDCRQASAVDEIRAYKLQAKVFYQLAEASPGLMCGEALMSMGFGKSPVYVSDFTASLEEQIESGEFLNYLIPWYMKIGMYSSKELFYIPGSDTQLRPEFIKKIQDAGFTPPK